MAKLRIKPVMRVAVKERRLDRYAAVKHAVSIHLTGDPAVVSARIPELRHVMGKPNIKMAWIAEPEHA